jgi:hypothetical protein
VNEKTVARSTFKRILLVLKRRDNSPRLSFARSPRLVLGNAALNFHAAQKLGNVPIVESLEKQNLQLTLADQKIRATRTRTLADILLDDPLPREPCKKLIKACGVP